MDIIAAIYMNDAVGFCVGLYLLQKLLVRPKSVAYVQHLFLLIGNPNQAIGAAPATLKVQCDFLDRPVRKHTVLRRHIERCRLKGKAQNAALVACLSHFPLKGGLKHIVYKKESAQTKRQRHDDHCR